jgi:hypothetical protein
MAATVKPFDESAVIWKQSTMPARPKLQNLYDASAAIFLMRKKFVTITTPARQRSAELSELCCKTPGQSRKRCDANYERSNLSGRC